MTVKVLISILSTCNPDTRVFSRGYEGGYNDTKPVVSKRVIHENVNAESYYGKHELDREHEAQSDAILVDVVIV